MKDFKYQKLAVTIPSGTVAETLKNLSIQLDTTHHVCVGVSVYEKANTSGAKYDIGLSDDNGVIHDLTDSRDWIPGSDAPMNSRYKDVEIPIVQGNKLKVLFQNDALLTAAVTFQVVFKLAKRQ